VSLVDRISKIGKEMEVPKARKTGDSVILLNSLNVTPTRSTASLWQPMISSTSP